MTNKPLSANGRLDARRMTDVKVFASDGREIKKCGLRDISVGGAYIKTKNFALPNGTNLELVLKIRRGGKPRHCRLPAQVIRADRDGVAVMFGDLDDELCNILLDIVNPPSDASSTIQDPRGP